MPEPACTVLFRRAGPRLSRPSVRRFAARLAEAVAPGRSFTCLLTDDRELRRLNRQFLGRDYPTDVLAFQWDRPPGLSFPDTEQDRAGALSYSLGELAISVQQAGAHGRRLEDQIGILMLHGLLHLLGMDHETDQGQMRRAETRWRKKLELP